MARESSWLQPCPLTENMWEQNIVRATRMTRWKGSDLQWKVWKEMKGGNKLLRSPISIPWVHLRSSENMWELRAVDTSSGTKVCADGEEWRIWLQNCHYSCGHCCWDWLQTLSASPWYRRRLENLGDMVEDTWKTFISFIDVLQIFFWHCLNLPIMILMWSFELHVFFSNSSKCSTWLVQEAFESDGVLHLFWAGRELPQDWGYWVHAGLGSLVKVKLCPSHCFTLLCRVGFASRFACIRSVPPRISGGFIEVDQCNCVAKPL